jgi:hypothetical protein
MLLNELVNNSVFNRGFEKTKDILDGKITLVAKHGYLPYSSTKKINVSHQFRIEALNGKQLVGWVNFERRGDDLEALDLVVNEPYRRKGIASQMYAFAKELGNSITPSSKQTALGKAFWTKDHRGE